MSLVVGECKFRGLNFPLCSLANDFFCKSSGNFNEALKKDLYHLFCRDSFGGGTLVGDLRWAGAYGIQADFVALSHCSIEIIKTVDIQVLTLFLLPIVYYPPNLNQQIFLTQALLEKFEFFPVKCRIQRAAEMYKKFLGRQAMHSGSPLKSKVLKFCT